MWAKKTSYVKELALKRLTSFIQEHPLSHFKNPLDWKQYIIQGQNEYPSWIKDINPTTNEVKENLEELINLAKSCYLSYWKKLYPILSE
jgi:hypothetical protein